jgi:hypothetical protein
MEIFQFHFFLHSAPGLTTRGFLFQPKKSCILFLHLKGELILSRKTPNVLNPQNLLTGKTRLSFA